MLVSCFTPRSNTALQSLQKGRNVDAHSATHVLGMPDLQLWVGSALQHMALSWTERAARLHSLVFVGLLGGGREGVGSGGGGGGGRTGDGGAGPGRCRMKRSLRGTPASN